MPRLSRPLVALLISLAALVNGCAELDPYPVTYGERAAKLAPPEGNMARVFFYGDTTAWNGGRLDRLWHPRILIDGTPIATPNGRGIVFFVDREPGELRISVDNDVRHPGERPPEGYEGQELVLSLEASRRYYVRLVRHGADSFFAMAPEPHYLELKPIHEVRGAVEIARFRYRG